MHQSFQTKRRIHRQLNTPNPFGPPSKPSTTTGVLSPPATRSTPGSPPGSKTSTTAAASTPAWAANPPSNTNYTKRPGQQPHKQTVNNLRTGPPWQRGTNENTNGLLRQYMPKGTDLSLLTEADLDAIADQVCDALTRRIHGLPEGAMRTLTWDQGREMARHQRLTPGTGVEVFFAHPHSPWEREEPAKTPTGLSAATCPKEPPSPA